MLMRFTTVQGGQGVFGIAIGSVWREVEGTSVSFPSQSIDDLENNQDDLSRYRIKRNVS